MKNSLATFQKLTLGSCTLFTSKTKADYSTSMKLLEEVGLRPLRSEEILFLLAKENNLTSKIKSRIRWFWLAGRGLAKDGIFKTNHQGSLIRIWGELSETVIVRASKGSQPLMLGFPSGKSRFNNAVHLAGDVLPDNKAPGILGVSNETGDLTKEKLQDASRTKQTNGKVIFKKAKSGTGVTLYVLKQDADYQTTLELLEKAGLQLFTPQELLRVFLNDSGLKKSFAGKGWFWVAGTNRLHQGGNFTIDNAYDFARTKREPDARLRERMIAIRKGKHPLSFAVVHDRAVGEDLQWPRYALNADVGPKNAANLVVGKK